MMMFERKNGGHVADQRLVDLENTVKELPGVLGCVILADGESSSAEVQAFARVGLDPEAVEALISAEAARAGLADAIQVIHVFELDAESMFGDRSTLLRAAEMAEQDARARGPLTQNVDVDDPDATPGEDFKSLDTRPIVQRVVLSSVSGAAEAEVALSGDSQVVGSARGEKTLHGLRVVAEATLHACKQLVDGFKVELTGASLVSVMGEEAVLVLVKRGNGQDLVGSALLREGPASEATVRATLDAVNRFLSN